MYGKFNVLGKQVERPAAVFFKDSLAEEKARAGNGAACSKQKARMVKIAGFAQEPKGISGGNPV